MLIFSVGMAVVSALAGAALAFSICAKRLRAVENQCFEIYRRIDETKSQVNGTRTGIFALSESFHAARLEMTKMEDARKNEAEGWLTVDAETAKSLSNLHKETERMSRALSILLSREDAAEAVRRIEQMLKEAPDVLTAEGEAARSKAMEDGIASILAYTAGKVPGVELTL